MQNKPSLLIFDVNETLLNMEPIKIAINQALSSDSGFDYWFGKLLQFSLVETVTDNYKDFGEIGEAALKMAAQNFSMKISEEGTKEIVGKMVQLDPHPGVSKALEKIKENGYKIVALTNGGQETAEKQLKYAKLEWFFDAVYSVEAVRKFKPHPSTYEYALQQQKAEAGEAMLVAAHAWDITGAGRAGLQTAFLQRPGKSLYPLTSDPTISANSLMDIAKALQA